MMWNQLGRRATVGLLVLGLALFGLTPIATAAPDLATGRPVTASSSQPEYPPSNATDGNPSSYWESGNNAFPQWIQVDLGSAVAVNRSC